MLRVSQIMTRDPMTVEKSDTLLTAIRCLRQGGFHSLPVVEGHQLVGIVTDRDLRLATNSPYVLHERWQDEYQLGHTPVAACMTPDPVSIQADATILQAARIVLEVERTI